MSHIIKKEDISISIGEFQEQGQTKQRLKVIGELITLRADDGSVYQCGQLWGPTGSTEFNVHDQERNLKEVPQEVPLLKPVEQPPEPGYYFANGSVMSSEESSHYRDRGSAPWTMGTAPPEIKRKENY